MKIFVEQKLKKSTLLISEVFVRRVVRFIITKYLPAKRNYQVNIFFVNSSVIIHLNKRFFHRAYATDVISLPLEKESNLAEVLLGDIFICGETAHRQAKEYGHAYQEEIVLLVVHGMLHLLGHDDIKPKDKKKMRGEEQKILRGIHAVS